MEQKIKILYVDDEPINLQLFEINMEDKFNVLLAEDGNEGLEVLDANNDISIIISDMKMPGMNGIEFLEKVKEKYPDKKCFILTGFEITLEIKEALDSSLILKYFRKPFNMKEIEGTINSTVL